ncbi:MAG: hypothetical protein QM762_07760 [Chryseolinea sp.]
MSSALTPLDVDSFCSVLKEPKNALVKQYQKLFSMENAELTFTDDALRAIADKAMKRHGRPRPAVDRGRDHARHHVRAA